MKAMTCRQLGGPCDLVHHGMTADEVIKAQDRHLRGRCHQGRHNSRTCPEGHEGPVEASHEGYGRTKRRRVTSLPFPNPDQ